MPYPLDDAMSLLPLDDLRWNQLRQTYGSAAGIPELLTRLRAEPYPRDRTVTERREDPDPWDEVWDSLYHQETIYTATYAAVPHLVEMAQDGPHEVRKAFVHFLGAVAAAREAPSIPEDLKATYQTSMDRAKALAWGVIDAVSSEDEGVYLLQALAALEGRLWLGRVLEDIPLEEFCSECRACGVDFYFSIHGETVALMIDDIVENPAAPRYPVRRPEGDHEELDWVVSTALRMNLPRVSKVVRYLFGSCECPKCGSQHSVEALLREAHDAPAVDSE